MRNILSDQTRVHVRAYESLPDRNVDRNTHTLAELLTKCFHVLAFFADNDARACGVDRHALFCAGLLNYGGSLKQRRGRFQDVPRTGL